MANSKTLPGLDTVRAIAILMVFCFHAGILQWGYLGVHLFFVLSGFLITRILLQAKQHGVGEYLTGFYGRRVLRIFPVYYLYLLVIFLLSLLPLHFSIKQNEQIHILWNQLPYAVSYLYNFFHASASFTTSRFLTHFWSLAVEEQFYIIWPVLIFFIPEKHLKKFFIALIILGPLVRFSEGLIHEIPSLSGFFVKELNIFVYVLPFSNFDAFATGALFTIISFNAKPSRFLILFFATVAAGITTEFIATGQILPTAFGFRPAMDDSYKWIWGYTVINFVSAVLIATVSQKKLFPSFFGNKQLNYIGKISYGMYIFHYPIILLFLAREFPGNLPVPVKIISALILTILVSGISYQFFEKKFLVLKDRYFPQPH